ncbi:MAG: shikimate kinase, partial [Myxococcota bacterium]|nr:shikimate kinase [Myxococcota bacterium]
GAAPRRRGPRSGHPRYTAAVQETVWLVGMMGAGKSSVGARLAERLGVSFVDADRVIEEEAGRDVAGIFAAEGEAGFRARERGVLERLAGRPAVVALGGGAMAQAGVPERLAASGTVVWLRARPETLLARLGEGTGRPLLGGLDARSRAERLRALLAAREAAYARADRVVDTDGLGVDGVVEAVLRALEAAA